MNRKHIIEQLIENELIWLHENFDKHALAQVVEFFVDGGFDSMSDKELSNHYDRIFKEEVSDGTT